MFRAAPLRSAGTPHASGRAGYALALGKRNTIMLRGLIDGFRAAIEYRYRSAQRKKALLEIERLEEEANHKRDLIRPATFAEVERYDPKINRIREHQCESNPRPIIKPEPPFYDVRTALIVIILLHIVAVVIAWLFK